MVVLALGVNESSSSNKSNNINNDDYLVYYQGAEGKPGVDFPVHSHIPRTTFSCKDVESGYYADLDTDCQVFHICEDGRKISFLCPNGTIFEQAELICEWWFKVNCTNSPNLYHESAEQLHEENAKRKANRKVHLNTNNNNHGAVMKMEERSSVSASQNGRRYDVRNQLVDKRKYQNNEITNNNSPNYNKNHERANEQSLKNDLVVNYKPETQNRKRPEQVEFVQSKAVSNPQRTTESEDVNRFSQKSKSRGDVKFINTPTYTTTEKYNTNNNKNNNNNNIGESSPKSSDNIVTGFSNVDNSQQYVRISTVQKTKTLKAANNRVVFSNPVPQRNTSIINNIKYNANKTNYNNNNQQVSSNVKEKNSGSSVVTSNQYASSFSSRKNPGDVKSTPRPFSHNQNSIGNKDFSKTDNKISQNLEHKNNAKQQSTVPFTRNDVVNKRIIEPTDSEESQITEETASYYKNSVNQIHQTPKSSSTSNPYPNHRSTYSDIKETKHYTTKSAAKLSSVTPQYVTTQSFNNRQPFIGIQVGAQIKSTTTTPSTSKPALTNTVKTNVRQKQENYDFSVKSNLQPNQLSSVEAGANAYLPKTNSRPKLLGAIRKSQPTTTIQPVTDQYVEATTFPISSGYQQQTNVRAKAHSFSFNTGNNNHELFTSAPLEVKTIRVNPKESEPFNVGNTENTIALTDTTTVRPFTYFNQNLSYAAEDSFNTGRSPTPNSLSIDSSIPSTAASNAVYDHTSANRFGYKNLATPAVGLDLNAEVPPPIDLNKGGSKLYVSNSITSTKSFPSYSSPSLNSVSSTPSSEKGFYVTKNVEYTSPKPKIFSEKDVYPLNDPKYRTAILKPKPFELASTTATKLLGAFQRTISDGYITPSIPYKVSTAGPFSLAPKINADDLLSVSPTLPTGRVAVSTPSSKVDEMINALIQMAKDGDSEDHSGEEPRPGLVVPPSAGPQTLHTLAVYFANALDEIASNTTEEYDAEKITTKPFIDKEKLTELLTTMTMSKYNELFNNGNEAKEELIETTTILSRIKTDSEDNDLEGQHSKNGLQTSRVRQLARVFTEALASYLHDPDTFRRVLEEVRPTEPPPLEYEAMEDTTDAKTNDDELLNFSDADVMSSYPPIFPTVPSVQPTWGYLLALNNATQKPNTSNNDLDGKNSLNPEFENLQSADSQSFISQYNNVNSDTKEDKAVESSTKNTVTDDLNIIPNNHWTTSPGVSHLWKTTFSIDPHSINANIETTESISAATEDNSYGDEDIDTDVEEGSKDTLNGSEEEQPQPLSLDENHHEINYDLRLLPKLTLNSTQVHGILIDFMNKSDESQRFQRILKKLNTTEQEFLDKMKEIESNPLTRRLILLLISECGTNATKEIEAKALPLHRLIIRKNSEEELLESSSSGVTFPQNNQPEKKSSSRFTEFVDPTLDEDSHDNRALQLLNSLYTIASKFGK